jgi:hypothetical protein
LLGAVGISEEESVVIVVVAVKEEFKVLSWANAAEGIISDPTTASHQRNLRILIKKLLITIVDIIA